MRRVELWADEPDRPPLCLDPRVLSLEPRKRDLHESARRAAYNDGTIVGFFLGIASAVLAWAIISGMLARFAVALVVVVARLLGWAL